MNFCPPEVSSDQVSVIDYCCDVITVQRHFVYRLIVAIGECVFRFVYK